MKAHRSLSVVMLGFGLLLARDVSVADPAPATADAAALDSPSARLKQSASELTAALREYRSSLERVLALHEEALGKAVEKQRTWRDLYERGTISRRELETGERAVQAAQAKVDQARREIETADHATAEAETMEAIASLPPPAPGEHQQTAALTRYQGRVVWSLPTIMPKLQQLFATRFGHELPISALGQTALHDRLGFDHRNAMDVAVYPDSKEGKALIDYLQSEGIPYIAYRSAVPGASSGAHVHVGQPSPRTTIVKETPRKP